MIQCIFLVRSLDFLNAFDQSFNFGEHSFCNILWLVCNCDGCFIVSFEVIIQCLLNILCVWSWGSACDFSLRLNCFLGYVSFSRLITSNNQQRFTVFTGQLAICKGFIRDLNAHSAFDQNFTIAKNILTVFWPVCYITYHNNVSETLICVFHWLQHAINFSYIERNIFF